jgi:hypothetical protein
MFIGVLGSLVQLLCCVSGVVVGCCVWGKGLCLFRTLLVGVWAQLAPVGELPVVARCRSRVCAEEPTGD